MSHLDCPSSDRLSAFVLGKLPAAELTEVAEHLDLCAECEGKTAELDGMADAVVGELRQISETGPAADGVATETAGTDEAARSGAATETWGEFRIVREIGRGGMGVVCEAYQGSLRRHVALKFLSERGDLARFRREARAAGRLHHTNIVPVFGVSEHRGRHFYVMQYIAGRGLDAVLAERARTGGAGAGFDDRRAARIGVQVAEALAYAHAQGVIHRDIKPSNLLLDDRETVWVTDFGLAHDASDTVTLTHTGDFLGTLRYVAPERLSGLGDERADIYGLGVTLYELVCGRAAHHEADRSVLLHKVLNREPARPRQLAPAIARDFETIVLRAMARDPAHRYATAEALAEDLRRFLDDRSILARRAGPIERSVRWARRNKLVAALLAALVLVFLTGFAGVTVQWRRANAEAVRANVKANSEATARAAEARARAAERELRIKAQLEIATRDFDKGAEFARKGDVDYGLLWMAQALVQTPAERPDFAEMVRANLADWEGHFFRRRAILDHRRLGTEFAQFRPDGRAIVTVCDDESARLWDVATGRLLCPPLQHPGVAVRCAAFSPDGRLVATGCQDGSVRLWDAATGKPAGPALEPGRDAGPRVPVIAIAFSPDARLLLGKGGRQRRTVWDVKTRRSLEPPKQAGAAVPAWFLPDGRRVVLLDGAFQMAGIWDTATGSLAAPTIAGQRLGFGGQRARAQDWELGGFFAGGLVMGTSDDGKAARLWDVDTGRAVASLPPAASELVSATLSPDGRLLFACYRDTTALIWDVVRNLPAPGVLPDTDFLPGGSFSPDGRWLVAIARPAIARVHDVATGRQIGSSLRHERPAPRVQRASFSPDGRLILTSWFRGDAVLWELGPTVPTRRREAPKPGDQAQRPAPVDSPETMGRGVPAFSRDGSRVVLNAPRIARLVEVRTGQPIGRPMLHRWAVGGPVAISPDGRRVATSSHDRGFNRGGSTSTWCQIFDAATGRPVSPLLPHSNFVSTMTFSPDGTVLATGDYSALVHLWNAETGARIGKPFYAGAIVWSVALSPDGRLLAAGTAEPAHRVTLWDRVTGRRRGDPAQLRGRVNHLAFRPDGAVLLAATRVGPVPLIDTATGQVRSFLRPNFRLMSIAFSPDGRLILTTGGDPGGGNARLWDAGSGEPASPVVRHAVPADSRVAFNPAGTAWAMEYRDGSVGLYDVATARPIGTAGPMRDGVTGIAFGPDGRSLQVADGRGNVFSWPLLPPAAGTAEAAVRDVQIRTGMKIDSGGAAAFVSRSDWGRLRAEAGDPLWNAFSLSPKSERGEAPDRRASHAAASTGSDFAPGATDDQAWHEANARDAEVLGDNFGAGWHLDRLIVAGPDDGLLYARRARVGLWAGHVDAARADIERAIRLGPRDRILDWLDHRAIDFLSEQRPADALRFLEPVIAARPDDWLTYALRAQALAALGRAAEREADEGMAIARGADISFVIRIAAERSRALRWAEAARLYDKAIAMGTVPYEVWMEAATAHLEIGDEEGFRRVCEIMRARHPAEIFEKNVASMLAGVATLGPRGTGDDGKVLGWIEPRPAAVDSSQKTMKRESLRVLGAVLYRSGRYREAIVRLNEAIAAGGGVIPQEDALFLALAHSRAGEPGKARALLAGPWSDAPDGPSAEDWWASRGRRLLRQEAVRLILDPSFAVDPFAP